MNNFYKVNDNQFPFGEYVKKLEQQDKRPKKVFVLGVYASAVHAKWIKGKETICQALAVASEPYIFWDGNVEEARKIIEKIKIPEAVGKLVLPNKNLNGPSAKVLENNILTPLGVTRKDAWLCDLLPESRLNPKQQYIIENKYNPIKTEFGLNDVTVPIEDGNFCDEARREEISNEIILSKAESLIILGDMPIKQYLKYVCNIDFKNLREYTQKYGYGTPYPVTICEYKINVIPIAHPRQIGGLGMSSSFWYEEHKRWEERLLKSNTMAQNKYSVQK